MALLARFAGFNRRGSLGPSRGLAVASLVTRVTLGRLFKRGFTFGITLAVTFGALGACASNDGQNGSLPPSDAGPDGAVVAGDGSVITTDANLADASGQQPGDDSGQVSIACTAPPFVAFATTITTVAMNNAVHALSGAHVGFTTCTGFTLTTDGAGQASTSVTKGIAYTPLYSSTGTISAVGAEVPGTADVETAPQLIDANASDAVPGYGANLSFVAIEIVAEGTSPCDKVDGVTLAVTGHPEATASYMKAAWPVDRNVASTTASVGPRAFVSGIVGATKVAVTGTKTGCSVKLVTASQTGNFVLLGGALSVGKATVTN